MKKTGMTRLSPLTQDEIKKHQLYPTESYDQVLQRLFGLRRMPTPIFKKKGGKR